MRDIEQGMAQYRTLLGLGPFWRLDTNYHGRLPQLEWHLRQQDAFTRWGDLYLAMIEPGQGEGIFHFGYATDDLNQRPGGVDVCFESFGATLADGRAALIHLDTAGQAAMVTRCPQGRLGRAEEVAALAAFLVSREALHITGGAYVIDGGRCVA